MANATLDAILIEFLSESDEILQRVSVNLSRLEKRDCSPELLDELYRDMHTMKGSAQLFGFTEIGVVAHAMETCLDPIRKTHQQPSEGLLNSIYKCVDLIEKHLGLIKSGSPATEGLADLEVILPRLFENAYLQVGNDFKTQKDLMGLAEELKLEKNQGTSPDVVPIPIKAQEAPVKQEPTQEIQKTEPTAEAANTGVSGDANSADSTIRVQVGLLDNLMNLVGEMVLVRNQVLQHSSRSEDLEFLNLSQRLDVVTSELQDQVMRTRMQPIGNVLGKFQRLIRDLSKDLGKRIDLTVQGKDTELDKTLLEAIKDPLTHIVRNSCDHGIEKTADRLAAGKPETGHILIRAFHEGGQVIVEISDDGHGMNRKRIVQKAVDKGLMTAEQAERLSDRDKLNLIFHPGFSTAEHVSSVSGRGVGMDVVKTNIERIGGSVELDSVERRGSTIRLRIPLTLAIVPAMLVRSGGDDYAIPQIKLVELVRVDREQENNSGIRLVQGRPVYELRGRLLPLVDLNKILKKELTGTANLEDRGTINIVVLNAEGDLFGLIVDEVLDTADIVVKPLSKFLKSLDVFSAATILGSGKVALILDPIGVTKVAQLALEKKVAESDFALAEKDTHASSDIQEFLLFRTRTDAKFAVPLCLVNRLEEFRRADLEYSGQQPVMQYRGAILPLIDLGAILGFSGEIEADDPLLPTIVVQRSGRSFGLVVREILDVFTINATIDDSIRDRFGVLGNLILNEEVVNVVDALGIIEKEVARLGGPVTSEATTDNTLVGQPLGEKIKVLYAEDVGFFRRQVTKLLSAHGFEVTAVEDGKKALDTLLSKGPKHYGLILSDIEMPHMNGYEFARAVKREESTRPIPMIALTTRFNQRDIEEGRNAGFDLYLEKLNPEVLLSKIQQILQGEKGLFQLKGQAS